jgi:predicted oxidoreductase
MKTIPLGNSGLMVPVIAQGCSGMRESSVEDIKTTILADLELGINFYDHANGYGNGYCEEVFGRAFLELGVPRKNIFIQTKVGDVHDVMYDFSKKHILTTVEGCLERLQTDYIDVLILHRPDALVEPEEVAEVFEILHSSGKVRFFGVSNHKTMQIKLLQKYTNYPIIVNQLQFGLGNASMIANGTAVNMNIDQAIERDGSVFDYCRIHNIAIQAWSPLRYGMFKEIILESDNYSELNIKLNELAIKYNVSNTTIAIAWILRHPAKIQVITGTLKPSRITDYANAVDITLTRIEWYELFKAAGYQTP